MRIISCHIENFGILENENIDFQPGLNQILRSNGGGKSTLAAFIRAMLFGFNNETARKVTENERKVVRPWQNGPFSGSMVFETQGRVYRIEREFGKNLKEDIVRIYDENTGLESTDFDGYERKIGEKLLGIDSDTYQRTVYTSQTDCTSSANSQISAMIGNVGTLDGDMSAYENADRYLKERCDYLTKERSTGQIAKLMSNETKLLAENANTDQIKAQLDKATADLSSYIQTGSKLETEIKNYTKLSKEVNEYSEYVAVVEKRELLSSAFGQARDRLNNLLDSRESENLSYSNMNEQELKDLYRQIYKRRDIVRDLDRMESIIKGFKVPKNVTKPRSRTGLYASILIIGAVIALICGFGYLYFDSMLGAVLPHAFKTPLLPTAFVALSCVVFMIICLATNRSAFHHRMEQYEAYLDEKERVERLNAQADSLDQQIRDIDDQTAAALDKYGMSEDDDSGILESIDMILHINSGYREKEAAQNEMNQAGQRLDSFDEKYRDILAKQLKMPDTYLTAAQIADYLEELRLRLADIEDKRRDTQSQISQLKSRFETGLSNRDNLAQIRQKIEDYEHEYYIDSMARKYLAMAKTKFSSSFKAPVEQAFKKYYATIDPENAERYKLNANFELSYEKYGASRDIRSLSKGLSDLAGICMRLAFLSAMYKDEKPCLLFDDSFVNLDDERLPHALELLEKISEEYQIIYMTCQSSRTLKDRLH